MRALSERIEGVSEDAKAAVVREFYDVAFRQRDPSSAARFLDRAYRNHSNATATDRRQYVASLEEFVGTYPFLQVDLVDVFQEGDRIVAETRTVAQPGDPPQTARAAFRVSSGKIVEQWDA